MVEADFLSLFFLFFLQPVVNRKQEVPPDFFQKCFMKGYLKTLPKKQKIWCMIHENNVRASC